jgi:DNA-binding transcriptional regulator YiaG
MTPKELRAALKRLHISQMELSRRLEVAPTTVRRWVAGTTRIPKAVELLISRWLANGI